MLRANRGDTSVTLTLMRTVLSGADALHQMKAIDSSVPVLGTSGFSADPVQSGRDGLRDLGAVDDVGVGLHPLLGELPAGREAARVGRRVAGSDEELRGRLI